MKKQSLTRGEVFAALQSNPLYGQLHKGKAEVESAIKHARAARAPAVVKGLQVAFDRFVARMIQIENAALKRAGHKS